MRIVFFLLIVSLSSQAQDSSGTLYLWKNGAPGFESRKNEPEQAKDWWVKNIHNPSLTVYLPLKERANGTAIVVCPGGGHRALVFNSEGKEAAKFLTGLGVTVFVLKYRLFREDNSPYKEENAWQDIFRAMRLVKNLATTYNIDTARIGVMGFSAGGEVAGWVSYHWNEGHRISHDNIDQLSARPAFQVLIYPGPLAVPDKVPASSPVTFLTAANDDTCCSPPIVRLLQMHREAGVPVEVHLFQQGNHAFNMGMRSKLVSLQHWPDRLADWLRDNGWTGKN